MATWIAHLRIAENQLAVHSGLDAMQSAIGGIAQDSVSLEVYETALA